MKLDSVCVKNFRSVEDSGEFKIDAVTCLVGKNEAGKSAVLLALAALNPHPATPTIFDKERDYPRRFLSNYAKRHPKEGAVAVTTQWLLSPDEKAQIETVVGTGCLISSTVIVSRKFEDSEPKIEVPVNYGAALVFLYDKFSLNTEERAVLEPANTTSELIALLATLTSATAKHNELKAYLATHGHVTGQIVALVRRMLPKFMYFSSYDRMAGAVQIEQTTQLIASGQITQDSNRSTKLFAEFLEYAGVPIKEIVGVSTYETFNAKLQAASNNITDQILEYWTQNPDLAVQVRLESSRPGDAAPFNSGTIARARIYNSLHRVDTPFSERSAGFVWFFSFLVKFAQVKEEQTPVVLLLDEPGLTLHGKAQADLLRFFNEKLAPSHQIIYSTHSPFMVPADNLASVRVVQDQVETKGPRRTPIGTKVSADVLTRDPDTLFPLQGALGYEITQSLFVGKNTLLVEGPSDILYIQAFSEALRKRGRTGLDVRWAICPAGGIDAIHPFVSLFAGNALNIAVLSDQAVGDKKKIEKLKRSEILKAGHFYSIGDLLTRTEGDIEDIFEPDLFVTVVNDCYDLDAAQRLTVAILAAADTTTTRIVKQVEAAFRVMPASIPEFSHYTPASWLIRNPVVLEKRTEAVERTLDRAESLFKTFNALL
jgi:energy-coupling factor transporter ATP-binding protein EcfA2